MYTIKLSALQKDLLINKYENIKTEFSGDYILFKAINGDFELTIYTNGKGDKFKAVINCENINNFLSENDFTEDQILVKKEKSSDSIEFINTDEQIGSDEVGFGDFFGPIVVVASYVDKKTMSLINQFGINDSKKLTDAKIREIVPQIVDKVSYSMLIVTNEKLIELVEKGYNLNQIKSILHNATLNRVFEKHNTVTNVFIDKFTSEEIYYKYNEKQSNKIDKITFEIHGESKFPSVALSSCIARYNFLKIFDEMNEKYNTTFPFGASTSVDKFALEFAKKHGLEETTKIIKVNFKNYKNLLENL